MRSKNYPVITFGSYIKIAQQKTTLELRQEVKLDLR